MDRAAQSLDLAAFGFVVEPPVVRTFGRPGGFALWMGNGNALDQKLEADEGVCFILLLGAVLLSFDDNDAIFGDAAIPQLQQSLLVERRKG